jgi:hypothetical protein
VTAITCEAISMLGSKPTLPNPSAATLKIRSWTRAMRDVPTGSQSLDAYLDGTGTPFDDIDAAMSSWNRPADRISGSNIVTIMFTDMVDPPN